MFDNLFGYAFLLFNRRFWNIIKLHFKKRSNQRNEEREIVKLSCELDLLTKDPYNRNKTHVSQYMKNYMIYGYMKDYGSIYEIIKHQNYDRMVIVVHPYGWDYNKVVHERDYAIKNMHNPIYNTLYHPLMNKFDDLHEYWHGWKLETK